eukprot:682560-Prorocentrum_minimum.AAC.1
MCDVYDVRCVTCATCVAGQPARRPGQAAPWRCPGVEHGDDGVPPRLRPPLPREDHPPQGRLPLPPEAQDPPPEALHAQDSGGRL